VCAVRACESPTPESMQLPQLVAAAAAVTAPDGFRFKPVTGDFLDPAFTIESSSYPEDEAATRDKLRMRIEEAPEFFYGVFQEVGSTSKIRGFVCGTLTASGTLTDEAMSIHEPEGTTLCIHSVVVEESMRRRGLATWMLRNYLARVAKSTKAARVLLICKSHLVGFYEGCGFTNIGLSAVVHGQDPWNDMSLEIER